MSTLNAWLAREAERERRRVSLEDVMVFGHFSRYLWYRLRFFALSKGLQTFLHVLELLLFFLFASQQVFITAVFVRLATAITSSAWWGGLEVFREGVRTRLKDGRFATIGPWVRRWVLYAALLATIVGAGTTLYLWINIRYSGFDVADAFTITCLLGLAINLVVRTFHNGAYAIRRVYRPVWSMLLPEVLQTATLFGLWPVMSIWSVPVSLFARNMTSAALTAWFTWNVYRDLEIAVFRNFGKSSGRSKRHGFVGITRFAAAALASASARVGHFWALSLFYFGTDDPDQWLDLFVYFVLAASLIEANVSWSKLFYFDFVKLEDNLFRRYREHLQRLVLRWSWGIGLLIWVPTVFATPWLLTNEFKSIVIITGLFFVTRARLAAGQVIAFCERQYLRILLVTLGMGLVAWLGRYLEFAPNVYLIWILATMMAGALFLNARALPKQPAGRALPLAAMVALSPGFGVSGRWIMSRIEPGRLAGGPPRLIQRFARQFGPIGCDGFRYLLWWEDQHDIAGKKRSPLEGCAAKRWETEIGPNGVQSLLTWRERWPTGRLPRPRNRQEVVNAFQARCPGNVCVRAGETAPAWLRRNLKWGERRAVLSEAEAHVTGRLPRRRLPVDVSALLEGEEIAVIFLIEGTVSPEVRRKWRRWLRRVALASTIDELEFPGRDGV